MVEAERGERAQLSEMGSGIVRRVQERPYATLFLAAMAGYVLGGGLFSRLTRPLARAAMGALLVPGFRERILGASWGMEAVSAA
jgi:hypothetical protein